MKKRDFVGQKFGRLEIVEEHPKRRNGKILWVCLCECGGSTTVDIYSLRSGNTRSCGCLHREILGEINKKHGLRKLKEYGVWYAMLRRCNNSDDKGYVNYGGRGITVSERWHDFESFLADMGECPKGYTIERLDNDKGYNSENCVWADRFAQVINRRMNKNNSTGTVGVHPGSGRAKDKWLAEIMRNNEKCKLGCFDTLEEAIAARKKAEQFFDSRSLSDTSKNDELFACLN